MNKNLKLNILSKIGIYVTLLSGFSFAKINEKYI